MTTKATPHTAYKCTTGTHPRTQDITTRARPKRGRWPCQLFAPAAHLGVNQLSVLPICPNEHDKERYLPKEHIKNNYAGRNRTRNKRQEDGAHTAVVSSAGTCLPTEPSTNAQNAGSTRYTAVSLPFTVEKGDRRHSLSASPFRNTQKPSQHTWSFPSLALLRRERNRTQTQTKQTSSDSSYSQQRTKHGERVLRNTAKNKRQPLE